MIAAIVFTTLTTWRRGREVVAERMRAVELPLDEFMARLGPDTVRVPGTAIYLTATGGETPRALQHNFEHNHVLHRDVVLATVRTAGAPRVADDARLGIEPLGQRHPADRGHLRLPGGAEPARARWPSRAGHRPRPGARTS